MRSLEFHISFITKKILRIEVLSKVNPIQLNTSTCRRLGDNPDSIGLRI